MYAKLTELLKTYKPYTVKEHPLAGIRALEKFINYSFCIL